MRKLFPVFDGQDEWVYLDTAATAHKPRAVIEEQARFYGQEYATVHRAIYQRSLAASEKYHEARKSAQRFLNAALVEEIVFTRGTTDGINLVALSLGRSFGAGDEIVVCETEHHSNLVPWQMLAERSGSVVKWAPVDDGGVLDMEAFRGLLSEKTKLVAVAHMSNVTGTIHPIRELADLAHGVGAKILVDGAQAAPHMKIDVQALDVDFYAFSGHKCYGPTGIGVLYGKKKWLEEMPPVQGGGDMVDRVELEGSSYQTAPLKFEAGTPLIGPVIALKPALDWLMELGLERVSEWEHELYDCMLQATSDIEGLRVIGTAPDKGALFTFTIDGVHPLDVATLLDLKSISVRSGHLCAQTALKRFGLTAALRASFGVYNTKEDVERFAQELKAIVRSLKS